MSTPKVSTITLVADGLAAAALLQQLHHIAVATRATDMRWDHLFEAKYKAQEAMLEGHARQINSGFMHLTPNETMEALKHASFTRDFNSPVYSNFLKKLREAGEAGVEMAQVFELAKAPGA